MMKKILLTAVLTLIGIHTATAQVGIGTETPEASAALEIKSSSQGLLPPRMTETERDAIINPVNGLIVYNVTSKCPNYYVDGAWQEWCGSDNLDGNGSLGSYREGTVHCLNTPTVVVDVTNPATGKTWMDRNLGATGITDTDAYGDLYQWGRGADGHQCRDSQTTTILSSSDHAGHGDFVISSTSPFDWHSPQVLNLWQGVNGTNNPCPIGYRVPTIGELDAERKSWSSDNPAGAFASPLKLPAAGSRNSNDGSVNDIGSLGNYWSNSLIQLSSSTGRYVYFNRFGSQLSNVSRGNGYSVRCIKD